MEIRARSASLWWVAWVVAGVTVYACVMILPSWLHALTPYDWQRGVIIAFLNGLLIAYGVSLAFSVVGLLIFGSLLFVRTSTARRGLILRGLLLCGSLLLSLGMMEASASAWRVWQHRDPSPVLTRPVIHERPEDQVSVAVASDRPEGPDETAPLRVLILGESSARGDPFHPNFSVGKALAWQLQQVFPRRNVVVDDHSEGGLSLMLAHLRLLDVTHRPDVVLLISGHNEYQARYAWGRTVRYYEGANPVEPEPTMMEQWLRRSPLNALILETREKQRLASPPWRVMTGRSLVDRPTCTQEENDEIIADFRHRLNAIASWSEQLGAVPIFVITASNDSGFEPSRSVLPSNTSLKDRTRFAQAFLDARELSESDPVAGIARFRELIAEQPGFAESHFRLARLCERRGEWDEAREHYRLARNLDGLPMRCPDFLRDIYHEVAAAHSGLILVDSPRVLSALAPHGILGDAQFHDAQHPNFASYLALTQNALDQLAERKLLGWPDDLPAPKIDPEACLRHFGFDASIWARACVRTSEFYQVVAPLRYSLSERFAMAARYERAAELIDAGTAPEALGIPGLGPPPKPAADVAAVTTGMPLPQGRHRVQRTRFAPHLQHPGTFRSRRPAKR